VAQAVLSIFIRGLQVVFQIRMRAGVIASSLQLANWTRFDDESS